MFAGSEAETLHYSKDGREDFRNLVLPFANTHQLEPSCCRRFRLKCGVASRPNSQLPYSKSIRNADPIRENTSIYIHHEFHTGGNVSLSSLGYEY